MFPDNGFKQWMKKEKEKLGELSLQHLHVSSREFMTSTFAGERFANLTFVFSLNQKQEKVGDLIYAIRFNTRDKEVSYDFKVENEEKCLILPEYEKNFSLFKQIVEDVKIIHETIMKDFQDVMHKNPETRLYFVFETFEHFRFSDDLNESLTFLNR